jgi:glyoxylase-like metal-dependent hydrolase (beta-lactamase superfamily II)
MIIYPFETPPAPGEFIAVAPGVKWIRMPLPFALDHINLWLIEDFDGWAIVDTGFGIEATWGLWETHFAGAMEGKPVTRIIVTHYHPDHVGSARWLSDRTGAQVWMTEAEFLTAHAVREGIAGWTRENGNALFRSHGLDARRLEAQTTRGNSFRRGVPTLPLVYRRMIDGDNISIGGNNWRVTTMFGHAPEHATLYCEALRVLISGDQVLPRITTNVGVWGSQPEGNPLKLFLDSFAKLKGLPEDVLVLPSHDRVFKGLHERIAQLRVHHDARLADVLAACDQPTSGTEMLPVLFRRALDDHQLMFALGETIAHLNYLHQSGQLARTQSEDGVYRFQRIAKQS